MSKLLSTTLIVSMTLGATVTQPMMQRSLTQISNRLSRNFTSAMNTQARQFSFFSNKIKTFLQTKQKEQQTKQQRETAKPQFKKNLANGMDCLVLGTLVALKETCATAKTPAQKHIADLAGMDINYKCQCNLLGKYFHAIEPKTEMLPTYSWRSNNERCESLIQHSNPKSLGELTEQVTNCSKCMKEFLEHYENLKRTKLTQKNNLEKVLESLEEPKKDKLD
ncbi:MAG: hypothetical protein WCE21_04465 [Candidatus Babeliales bacterium]